MSLTRDFKETMRARIERDPGFREALLEDGVECLLSGDVETGKSVLRDYINATIGFQELGGLTDKSPKSLMRMLGPSGNPQAPQPVRDHRLPSEARRPAPEGPDGPVADDNPWVIKPSCYGPEYCQTNWVDPVAVPLGQAGQRLGDSDEWPVERMENG